MTPKGIVTHKLRRGVWEPSGFLLSICKVHILPLFCNSHSSAWPACGPSAVHNEAGPHRRQVCEAGEAPNEHVKAFSEEAQHCNGALQWSPAQCAWAEDTEGQGLYAHCPIVTQFFSSIHGALAKWTARGHQTNVSLYLLSLSPIILHFSSQKKYKREEHIAFSHL